MPAPQDTPTRTAAEKNAAYRAEYRAEVLPTRYSGRLHFAFAVTSTLGALVFSVSQLHDVQALEWLCLPLAFLIANGAEYFGHRYPMHRALPGLKAMCKRHAGQHHRFYTHEHMVAADARDWHLVLFPPPMLLFFIGGIALPVGTLVFVLFGANVGYLFVATASAYVLNYECLHLAYHLPEDSFVGRLPLVGRLRVLHTVHHDPSRMTKVNFNITYPIFDLLMGTYRRALVEDGGRASAPAEAAPSSR